MPFCSDRELEESISALEERARPSKNDIRYERYVNCINCFVSKFGNERVYLVGSTGERSKLAYSKDDGDADFLLVSGKLEIPIENLVPNEYSPCYVWIKADSLYENSGCEIIQGEYLSTKRLRNVGPELFSILRAIYLHVTSKTDKLPEADENKTVLTISSKVGLQTTNYRGLKFDKSLKEIKEKIPNVGTRKCQSDRGASLRNVQVHDHEKKIYKRLYEVAKLALPQSKRRRNNGGIAFFNQIIGEILKKENCRFHPQRCRDTSLCSKCDNMDECVRYQNDLTCADPMTDNIPVYRATYSEISHKDFVPALKIKGVFECMRLWRTRVKASSNLSSEMVDRIYESPIFVVARTSPVNPNIEKDFCLSFNLPEKEMMLSTTPLQKTVFLIMKAFLKGSFENEHAVKGKELKLKTYHIKHLLFWLYEKREMIETESVSELLQKALESLTDALCEKNLRHYFVESNNLFVDFEDTDYRFLLECVFKVQERPLECLEFYINLNNKNTREVWLSGDEISCLLEMSADGGRNEIIQKTEEAMVDFQRGVNEMRTAGGCSPIIEAIVDTVKLCLEVEGSANLSFFENFNAVLTNGQTELAQSDKHKEDRNIEDVATFIDDLSGVIKKFRYFMDHFGGKDGIKHILRGAFCGKRLDINIDIRKQIVDTLHRYLSCSDREEEDELISELKYKTFGYLLCRQEFSNSSEFREV